MNVFYGIYVDVYKELGSLNDLCLVENGPSLLKRFLLGPDVDTPPLMFLEHKLALKPKYGFVVFAVNEFGISLRTEV